MSTGLPPGWRVVSTSPSPLPPGWNFVGPPSPEPQPSPLDNLFAPQPSPSPLSSPPAGPDVVDVPGGEEGPELSIAERIQRVLQRYGGMAAHLAPGAPSTAPPPGELPISGTDAVRTITSPIPAIQQAMQRETTRRGTNLETSDQDPGRPLNIPGPEFLPREVRAAIRGFDEGLMEEVVGSTTPLDIATLPAGMSTRVLAALGKGGSAAYRAARLAEIGGGALMVGEGVPDVVGGAVEGDLGQVGRGLLRAGMGGLMTRGPSTLAGRQAEEAASMAGRVDAALARREAPEVVVGPAGAPDGPPLDVPGRTVTEPPPPVTGPPAHPDADLLTGAIEALRQPGAKGADRGGLIRAADGTVTGRYGNPPHPAKLDLGLSGFTESPARMAAALQRLADGKPSELGERVLAEIKGNAAEELASRERARVADNTAAGRASFDPEALELTAIEGSAHGSGDDYSEIVLGAANTHLGAVEGTGVVAGDAPTGQRWYGVRGEDGKIGAALSVTKEGLITDWAGSGPGTGLVIRRAIKDNPDLTFDFDSLSDDSARILNRVMNSGTRIGENVRVQYEAHLAERAGGTVAPGGTDGPNQGVGSTGGGGRGGGAGGIPPETVVEPVGEGAPREGQSGSGGGEPPNRPPTAEGVAPDQPRRPGHQPGAPYGGASAQGPHDPVAKLLALIRQAPAAIRQTEAMRMPERIRRSQEVGRILNSVGGREGLQQAKSALKGELPQADFAPVGPKLTEAEATELLDRAKRHPDLQPFERMNAADALANILDGGRIPQRHEIALLERVFGEEMTDAILSRRHWTKKAGEEIIDSFGLLRSIRTAYDMSAPLRQGLVLTVRHPVIAARAGRHMVAAAFSPKAFNAVQAEIRARPNAELYNSTGLYLASTSRAAGLRGREEAFATRYAKYVPGLAGSERSYVGYLNKLRADVFDHVDSVWRKGGVTPETSPSRYTGLAEYINMASGRGHLGQLERIAPLMSWVFFSPRFMMGRLQAINPMTYARMDPAVRRIAAQDMAATLGAGIAIISLAKLGGAEVEIDPRSSDFGKIRVGRTRIDVWGGFQQPMRYLAQLATGQRKPEQGGIQPQRDRVQTAGRFVRSKLAPIPSAAMDLASGKNFLGENVTLEGEAKELFPPMFLQDFLEAVQEHGFVTGAALAAPSFFGVGVTTHQPRGESRGR